MKHRLIALAVSLALAWPAMASAQPGSLSPADAPASVDRWMKTMDDQVLSDARASGDKFPAYDKWLAAESDAIAAGMSPSALEVLPGATEASQARALRLAGDDARQELSPYTPAPPDTKDLAKIAAFKEQTDPSRLAKLLLSVLSKEGGATRQAASTHLYSTYKLPN